jgi:hypothetical protein
MKDTENKKVARKKRRRQRSGKGALIIEFRKSNARGMPIYGA